MNPRRGKPDQGVAGPDIRPRQQLPALGRPDAETCKIVVLLRIKARHLRRLAPDQGTARQPAALGNAGNHRARRLQVELPAGKIVEKEQRFGALHQHIVHAHGDEIDADAAVLPRGDGDLELGADAVVGGNQDRVLEAGPLEVEQAAEAAERRICAGAQGRLGEGLDGLDQGVADVDVDAGIAVGEGLVLRPAWHGLKALP